MSDAFSNEDVANILNKRITQSWAQLDVNSHAKWNKAPRPRPKSIFIQVLAYYSDVWSRLILFWKNNLCFNRYHCVSLHEGSIPIVETR